MIIKVDTRENDLMQQINYFITNIPIFKKINVKSETLPIGDIIITDDLENEKLIIERKTVADLMASIKDGRYEEQSYRLNGINHHNHNIIYLIEGDLNKINRFKPESTVEKLTLYSAMFSLNYYKGFSLFRTTSLEETATVICNMAYKLEKEKASNKKAYYSNSNSDQINEIVSKLPEEVSVISGVKIIKMELPLENINENDQNNCSKKEEPNDKDYVNVVKKVKKENITTENIDEILLCQIPGISSVTALAIIEKYKSIVNLIKEIEKDNACLNNISYINAKGQSRKINKTSVLNILKFLLKK